MEDFGVVIIPGLVDSHVRREVAGGLLEAVMIIDVRQQWFVPAAAGWVKRQVTVMRAKRKSWNVKPKSLTYKKICPHSSQPQRYLTIVVLEVSQF